MGVKIRKRGGKWYVFVNYHGRRKAKCVGSSRELAEQVRRQLGRDQVAVGPQPAEPPRPRQPPVGPQTYRHHLDDAKPRRRQQAHRLAAREQLTLAWESLPAWPDAAPGLERLAQRFTLSTLSNGNQSQQAALIRFAGLPFRRLLSAEDFRHYKPDPEVYLGAASALGLQPGQVMMVAAHKSDLRAAQAAGLKAAFVERPLEKGRGGGADLLPDPLADVQAADFIDLAGKLGC